MVPCGLVSKVKTGLTSINSAVEERRINSSNKFSNDEFMDVARAYQVGPDYLRVMAKEHAMITCDPQTQRRMIIARLSKSFQKLFCCVRWTSSKTGIIGSCGERLEAGV